MNTVSVEVKRLVSTYTIRTTKFRDCGYVDRQREVGEESVQGSCTDSKTGLQERTKSVRG